MDKGKGRASDALEASTYFDSASIDEDDSRSTADYETALESALYDESSSSTYRPENGANGNGQHEQQEEEEGEFIYDGQDDEDMKVFREEAKLDSLDYKERLRNVLGDAAEVAKLEEDAISANDLTTPRRMSYVGENGPSMSTPPRSPTGSTSSLSRSLATVRRRNSAERSKDRSSPSPPPEERMLPMSQPFPRPPARPPSVSSPSSSTHSSFAFPQDSSQILPSPQSSRFGSVPARRPLMNPLVSRLRSTSATPSQSFRGVRSISQTSSLASLALQDADDLHGFANDSFMLGANESFGSIAKNGRYAGSLSGSRRSSSSNLRDAKTGGVQMSPSPSSAANREGDTTSNTLYPPARRKGQAAPLPEVHQLVPPLKWTTLRRLSQRLFSHPSNNGKGAGVISDPGTPTCFAVSGGLIVVGTAKGWTMIYDYSQSLKAIVGNDEISRSCGRVTAVALSQDSTFVAAAYHSGYIHLFEWAKKPAVPARTVIPTTLAAVNAGKAEGHLARDASGHGSEIQHLGFVGRRHTAIVSGDQYGLAFYHSLGKVLGLANTDILRILGKYPAQLATQTSTHANGHSQSQASYSRLLGVQALPLGTEEDFTDEFNLVALLTPDKLVVAGLKPSPKTWWRFVNQPDMAMKSSAEIASAGVSSRSSEADLAHLSELEPKDTHKDHGCLAWLPAINGEAPILAWCWGGRLRLVRLQKGHSDGDATTNGTSPMARQVRLNGKAERVNSKAASAVTPSFELVAGKGTTPLAKVKRYSKPETVYDCDETIYAVQWLNRNTLALLTMSKILLFDIRALSMIEECSHFGPHFALPQMRPLEQSFKAYKGKFFYLTAHDLRVGSLLSWADRVLHLVSAGQLVEAIELLVFYYGGRASESDVAAVPLPTATLEIPQNLDERRAAVEPRLKEILMASADYAFSEDRMRDEAVADREGFNRGVDRTELFENLVDATIRASLAIESYDFLFNDLWERYSDNGIEGIFLDRLEPFIRTGDITKLPVGISQQLISKYAEKGQMREAEDLIWRLDPISLDVNQVVSLCSQYRLYDALTYVYTRALHDFVGPFVQMLHLLVEILQDRQKRPRHIGEFEQDSDMQSLSDDLELLVPTAYTIYSYLADSLVGLTHPNQENLETEAALNAKQSLYDFLFSDTLKVYPPGSDQLVYAVQDDNRPLPYLRLLLLFDTEATLDCLDIALEDPYLDEDALTHGTPDRQAIVKKLLYISEDHTELVKGLSESDRTFVNIFVARNIPKYSQFLKLEPNVMQRVLEELCLDRDLSTRHDRELAVEYLLSAYSPTYDTAILDMLEQAEFYRVLASIYRSRKAWPQLTSVCLRDTELGHELFGTLAQILRDASTDGSDMLPLVKAEIVSSTSQLVESGALELCSLVERLMPEEHANVLQALQDSPIRQIAYLRCLLEPNLDEEPPQSIKAPSRNIDDNIRYMYVALLSQYDPSSVMRYLETEPTLDEQQIVEICRARGNYEAVIWILSSHGEVKQSLSIARDAMAKQSELLLGALLAQPSSNNLRQPLQKLVNISRTALQVAGKVCLSKDGHRDIPVEDVWYNVLSSLIDTVRDIHRFVETTADGVPLEGSDAFDTVKQLVPQAISILISSTSSETLSLPHLVRRLMDGSAGSTYSEYKDILDGMLDTYRFEENVLSTAKRLLELDVHEEVAELVKARGSGWRPNPSGICEACGRSVWARTNEADKLSNPRLVVRSASDIEVSEKMRIRPKVRRRPSLKGKETDWYEEESHKIDQDGPRSQSLVVFKGGAICHAACLEQGGMVR